MQPWMIESAGGSPELWQPMRVASWNLQSCRRGLPGVAAQLRSIDADVVALQEVDRGTSRSGGLDQAAWLARETGLPHHCFFKAASKFDGDYGLALLSRYPISSPRVNLLPARPHLEQRILASVTLEHPCGELAVHVTHLSHRILVARGLRLEQTQHIRQLLAEEPALPRLLLGDFNDLPASPMHRELSRQFVDVFAAVGSGPSGTHPFLGGLFPSVCIDYVFASSELRLDSARVVPTLASDHYVLLAEVAAPGRAAQRAAG